MGFDFVDIFLEVEALRVWKENGLLNGLVGIIQT